MPRQGECLRWDVTRGPHAGLSGALCALQTAVVGPEKPAADAQETRGVLLTLGRHKNCILRLRKDLEVSTMHADVRRIPGSTELLVRDLGSTNGTRVNGSVLVPKQDYPLGAQDLVVVGKTAVRVVRDDACTHGQPGPVVVKEEAKAAEDAPLAVEPAEDSTGHGKQDEQNSAPAPAQDQFLPEAPEAPAEEAQAPVQYNAVAANVCPEIVAAEIPAQAPQPPIDQANGAIASETKRVMCMICHCWLGALDVLEQQLHINACLDGTAQPLATTTDRQVMAPVRARPPGKRKRTANKIDAAADEPMALALALSKSMVEPEQQMEMELQQQTMELAQIDVQMQQLAKKRARIVKKMQKVSAEMLKQSKSQVLAPEEAHVLCQLDRVLHILFPSASREREDEGLRIPRKRKRCSGGSEAEEQTVDAAVARVSMWTRASQAANEKQDCELYVNSILKPFVQAQDRQEKQSSEQQPLDVDDEDYSNDVLEVLARPPPPDCVVRTFPDWRENLLFLETQTVESLQDALVELRRSREMRHQQHEPQEDEDVVGLLGSSAAEQQDQDDACAYFEQVMTELIEKRRVHDATAPASSTHPSEPIVIDIDEQEEEGRRVSSFQGDANESVISIPDSIDYQENLHALDFDEPECPASPEDHGLCVQVDAGITTEKSTAEVLELESSSPSVPVQEHHSSNDIHHQQEQEPVGFNVLEEATQESPSDVVAADTTPGISSVQSISSSADPIETQLLQALKAHSKLYEAVLLLQPVAVNEFFHYVTQDAGIACTKAMLYQFFDRHGITFKGP